MKKLLLGLCLVFGANVLNANQYACKYSFKMAQDSLEKSRKAIDLELVAEARGYFNDTNYYIKQVLINCDKNSEEWQVAKQVFDALKETE